MLQIPVPFLVQLQAAVACRHPALSFDLAIRWHARRFEAGSTPSLYLHYFLLRSYRCFPSPPHLSLSSSPSPYYVLAVETRDFPVALVPGRGNNALSLLPSLNGLRLLEAGCRRPRSPQITQPRSRRRSFKRRKLQGYSRQGKAIWEFRSRSRIGIWGRDGSGA